MAHKYSTVHSDDVMQKRASASSRYVSLVQKNKIISTFTIERLGNAQELAKAVCKASLMPIALYGHERTHNRLHRSHRRFNQIPASWKLMFEIEPKSSGTTGNANN